MSKILIYGAGAVGQFIGGLLTRAGKHNVSMVCRPDQYAAIKKSGLAIDRINGSDYLRKLNVYPSLERIPQSETFDWIFLTVKTYSIKEALRSLKNIITSNRRMNFLLFQRGVGSHEVFEGFIPSDKIFLASLTANIVNLSPGKIIEMNTGGNLNIAPLGRQDTSDILSIFAGAKINVSSHKNWQVMKWSALMYEMFANGLCALSDYNAKKLFDKEKLVLIELEALHEAMKLASELGISPVNLPACPAKKLAFYNGLPDFIKIPFIKKIVNDPRNLRKESIKEDIEKGKKFSEINFLNGAVVKWGRERKISTPANEFITEELLKIIDGKIDWERYRIKPDVIFESFKVFKQNYKQK